VLILNYVVVPEKVKETVEAAPNQAKGNKYLEGKR
jgi:hypothetical protein